MQLRPMGDATNHAHTQPPGKITMRYLPRLFGEAETLENKGHWVIRKQGHLAFVKASLPSPVVNDISSGTDIHPNRLSVTVMNN